MEPIEEVTEEIRTLVDDMIDTMRNGETPGVGLAAPQIGKALRITARDLRTGCREDHKPGLSGISG